MKAVAQLQREVEKRERELALLRRALATLKGIDGKGSGKGNRAPRTEEQKRKLSLALKRAWRARKAGQRSKPAAKGAPTAG